MSKDLICKEKKLNKIKKSNTKIFNFDSNYKNA